MSEMGTISWVIVGLLVLLFLFVVIPIAMHLWGSMFAKGFFSSMNIFKHSNKKQNTDEHKKN